MKTRTLFFLFLLAILCFALSGIAFADIYDNGPINGNTYAFFIDGPGGPFGQSVSDGFVAPRAFIATTLNFGEWTLGGAPTVVNWSLGTTSFGSDIGRGGGAVTSSFLGINSFGYGIYNTEIGVSGYFNFGNTYYLTLSGANDAGGSQFDAWDDNEGPASCYFENPNGSGGCPTSESESFTLNGACMCGCGLAGPHCGEPVLEPSNILLFGSGILAFAGVLRRKLHF